MYQTALVDKAKKLNAKYSETEELMKNVDSDSEFRELRLQSVLLKNKRDSVKAKIGNYGTYGYKEKTKRTIEKSTTIVITQKIKIAYIIQIRF